MAKGDINTRAAGVVRAATGQEEGYTPEQLATASEFMNKLPEPTSYPDDTIIRETSRDLGLHHQYVFKKSKSEQSWTLFDIHPISGDIAKK
jgi:hypothetical protein